MLFDLISVSSRYIDRELFLSPRVADKAFKMEEADKRILQDTSHFRVFEPRLGLSGSRTSFFHNSIGGYHGAKPRRFEELFNYSSINNISGVINMLNVKYLLVRENGILKAQINENALGNAWTVDSIIIAETADIALEKMKTLNFKNSAVVIKTELPKEAKEGGKKEKERIQVYEGVVIAKHNNSKKTNSTITVRKMFQGGGIEKVFLLNSPWIKDITVVSRAQVRRAKLYYLRERTGKSARLKRKI